jgi:heme exporter protein B
MRELRLALRQGSDVAMVVSFFVITVTLFPLGVGPEPNVLARIAAGVVWVTALLAVMLSLERMFQSDYEDGSVDLLLTAHWLLTGFPLIVTAPVLAALMNMPGEGYVVLIATMALATPTLSLIGSVGAALTLGARRGGVLISLLVLPLYIPVLIFAVAAVDAAITDLSTRPHMLILGAMLAAALPLAPWAAAAALRHGLR